MSTVASELYLAISVATLRPEALTGISLYVKQAEDDYALYRAPDYPITQADLERLRQRGVQRLYISPDSRSAYQKYLREIALNQNDDVPLSVRTGALAEIVRDVLDFAFDADDVDRIVESSEVLGHLSGKLICRSDFAINDLLSVLHHDYGTFTHSANVSFYAGVLAKKLGYSDADVEKIISAGLLHDLGKLGIEESILLKPGKLDDREFRLIQRHPIIGFARLCERPDVSFGQLMMVYQHHERLDGRGYPVGLTEKDIHPWAKLCAVVDVYEACTSHRPYRQPMSPASALNILEKDSGTAFEPEVVACWANIIRASLKK